jgi:hypothetical protein
MLLAATIVLGAQEKKAPTKVAVSAQRGTDLPIYSPRKHDLYDGKFVMSAGNVYMAGTLNDAPGWDHIDNDAKNLHAVKGTFEIDVDEIKNTGTCTGKFELPGGDVLEVAFDSFKEGSPCQDGGIAAFIFEHGDSGCGDALWPKTLTYLAGWGTGHAKLNGKPLYDKYQIHFMVTQGMRDRKTRKVNYPMDPTEKRQPAGEVNPAAIQLDFWIRSPEDDPAKKNNPPKKDFLHLFAMEVTWK